MILINIMQLALFAVGYQCQRYSIALRTTLFSDLSKLAKGRAKWGKLIGVHDNEFHNLSPEYFYCAYIIYDVIPIIEVLVLAVLHGRSIDDIGLWGGRHFFS